jgi:glycosyltransferase involved in cell wall biosynthesis
MKRIVLSGVNLAEMGPIRIYEEALRAAVDLFEGGYEIVAIVHRKELFAVPGVRYLEFPGIRKSWLRRLSFEYLQLKPLSKELNADLWLSMHDITPNVEARRRAVYCHNPAPFYSLRLRDALISWKFAAFVLFYGYLYGINIRKNDTVIVQQDWIRREFKMRYAPGNIVVAHPAVDEARTGPEIPDLPSSDGVYRFFYPAFPRPFKNFEVVLEATSILERESVHAFEVWLTLDARTNRYANATVSKYRHLDCVKWLGILDHAMVREGYRRTDCLLFPSRLETWGLPITEFKETKRPMIVADLPYARETVGTYDSVAFFNQDDPAQLAQLMKGAIYGDPVFERAQAKAIAPPFARNWSELWKILVHEAS